jgi:hypothetical protein
MYASLCIFNGGSSRSVHIAGVIVARSVKIRSSVLVVSTGAKAMIIPATASTSTYENPPIEDPVEALMNPASCGPAIAPAPYARKMTL